MKILIATHKSWNIDRANKLINIETGHDIKLVTQKEELTPEMVKEFNPDIIFFPHWSYYIPAEIYENRECIVFHMTDLPYGRGGSPLQNLIARGIKKTKLSAIRVTGELDAGPIYLKENLDLYGSAREIFERAADIIFEKMIPALMNGNIIPKEQSGEVVTFKRRNKDDGEIVQSMTLGTIYDYIRMLDAEGYPNAFIRFGDFIMEFSEADYNDESITAKVVIHKNIEQRI